MDAHVVRTSRAEREAAAWDDLYTRQRQTRSSAGKYYAASAEAERQERRLIAAICAGRQVLDYGCGTGQRAIEMVRLGATVVGIDVSGNAIRLARERAGGIDGLAFLQMNAEAMSFSDDHFDLVCGNAILHHLDLRAACREIARVLKPGGRAVFREPLGHNALINLYRRRTRAMRTVDEHPLRTADLDTIAEHFAHVHVHYHVLTALMAVPFRTLRGSGQLFRALHAVDRVLFRLPVFQRQAWQVVIDAHG